MKCVILRTAAAFLAAVLLYPSPAGAISAQCAIVTDGHTGRVIYEKNPDRQCLIASTTKIMTALIVCQQCNVLEQMVIPKEATGIEGSSMYLQAGEVLTIQELLYGLMLSSGNDAAIALAIYCGGSVAEFVELMNAQAQKLGLRNTHFENPHGLDTPGHYSSARDLAILAEYAMHNPVFAQTVGTKQVRITDRCLQNHNKLLWQVDGAEGIKTGFTKAAGRILVSCAQRYGRRVICVTIHDPDDWEDHKQMYKDAFGRFSMRQIVVAGEPLGELAVFGGGQEKVTVVAAENFSFAMADGEKISFVLSKKEFVYAPIAAGGDAGFAYVCIEGRMVGKVRVTFLDTVEQTAAQKKNFWQRIWGGKT